MTSAELTVPILLLLFVFASVAGFAVLAFAWFCWHRIERYRPEVLVKPVIEVINGVLGLTTAAVGYGLATDKSAWASVVIYGTDCVGSWKALQGYLEYKVKRSEDRKKADLEAAQRQGIRSSQLLGALRGLVQAKAGRLHTAVERYGPKARRYLRVALTPDVHLDDLLMTAARYFRGLLPEADRETRNFRIGVFVEMDGVMVPMYALDLRNPELNPFGETFAANVGHFQMDSPTPALVVEAVRTESLLVRENCEESASKGEFAFYGTDQKHFLRSAVSYFFGKVCLGCATIKSSALYIDTDVPGFFKEGEKAEILFYLQEFGARVRLEILLQTTFHPPKVSSGDKQIPSDANREAGPQAGPASEDGDDR